MKIIRTILIFLLAFTYAQAQVTPSATATTPVRYLDFVFSSWTITTGQYQPGYEYNLYQPVGDDLKKRPVVIVYHAGGGNIADVRQWCEDFCKLGYIAVAAQYKLGSGDFNYQEQINAIINSWILIDYLRIHASDFGIKKKKIFEHGISAGAITAVQSGICLNDKDDPIFKGVLPGKTKIVILGTGTKSGAISPDFLRFVNLGDPANFFYNGVEDKTIKYSQAVESYNKEISSGIAANLMSFPGKDHKLEGCYEIIFNDLKVRYYNLLNPK